MTNFMLGLKRCLTRYQCCLLYVFNRSSIQSCTGRARSLSDGVARSLGPPALPVLDCAVRPLLYPWSEDHLRTWTLASQKSNVAASNTYLIDVHRYPAIGFLCELLWFVWSEDRWAPHRSGLSERLHLARRYARLKK